MSWFNKVIFQLIITSDSFPFAKSDKMGPNLAPLSLDGCQVYVTAECHPYTSPRCVISWSAEPDGWMTHVLCQAPKSLTLVKWLLKLSNDIWRHSPPCYYKRCLIYSQVGKSQTWKHSKCRLFLFLYTDFI